VCDIFKNCSKNGSNQERCQNIFRITQSNCIVRCLGQGLLVKTPGCIHIHRTFFRNCWWNFCWNIIQNWLPNVQRPTLQGTTSDRAVGKVIFHLKRKGPPHPSCVVLCRPRCFLFLVLICEALLFFFVRNLSFFVGMDSIDLQVLMEAKDEELFGAERCNFLVGDWSFRVHESDDLNLSDKKPGCQMFPTSPRLVPRFFETCKNYRVENWPPIQVLLQPSVTVDVFCLVLLGK